MISYRFKSKERGFTIVEFFVSFSIMLMLVSLLFAFLLIVSKLSTRTSFLEDSATALDSALGILLQDITNLGTVGTSKIIVYTDKDINNDDMAILTGCYTVRGGLVEVQESCVKQYYQEWNSLDMNLRDYGFLPDVLEVVSVAELDNDYSTQENLRIYWGLLRDERGELYIARAFLDEKNFYVNNCEDLGGEVFSNYCITRVVSLSGLGLDRRLFDDVNLRFTNVPLWKNVLPVYSGGTLSSTSFDQSAWNVEFSLGLRYRENFSDYSDSTKQVLITRLRTSLDILQAHWSEYWGNNYGRYLRRSFSIKIKVR